ncbi:hypothetical protein ASPTUDRAFT_30290 [Aspergillus tubingensis CBS 134.48]|uniref:Uncharacterized protein n=1 Tax=Aspergillus tubingensis (strain CBS 134.48) TaxID=767770 RepID=A0A1L9N5E2_ASPTC|nr:hypothetical protein ASPTUDRAFT_30290 [Aspergillus tubingensis CBS 134.48]
MSIRIISTNQTCALFEFEASFFGETFWDEPAGGQPFYPPTSPYDYPQSRQTHDSTLLADLWFKPSPGTIIYVVAAAPLSDPGADGSRSSMTGWSTVGSVRLALEVWGFPH